MDPYKRQRKYLQSEKGKEALRKYRERPDVKEKQKIYQQFYKEKKRYSENLRYYYATDPLPSIRKLYCEATLVPNY